MKHCSLLLVAAIIAMTATGAQAAVQIQVTYTGDNIIGAFYQDGAAPVSVLLGPNAADWTRADTATLSLNYGTPYQLIFLVSNVGGVGSGNPAAFLAEIQGPATGELLTSASWEYAAYDGSNTPGNFNSLTWAAATSFGTNAPFDPNIWSPVAGISSSAEWIWSSDNFGNLQAGTRWLRGQITTSPVPEPASLLIWSLMGLAGFGAAFWRKRRAA